MTYKIINMQEISTRQQEIIEAAGKILTDAGVGGLTTKRLAKEIGFSESAIYRHFASKEDIIIALLEYLREDMNKRLSESVVTDLSPEEKFKKLFQSQFSFFEKNTHFVVAVFSDGLLEESDKIGQAILSLMQVKMKYLLPVIMEGQQKGVFTKAITTEELVHIIMGTFRLQMFKWRIADFKFDIQRNGQNMLEALLTIMKP